MERILFWRNERLDVFCYFDNHEAGAHDVTIRNNAIIEKAIGVLTCHDTEEGYDDPDLAVRDVSMQCNVFDDVLIGAAVLPNTRNLSIGYGNLSLRTQEKGIPEGANTFSSEIAEVLALPAVRIGTRHEEPEGYVHPQLCGIRPHQ